MAFSDAERMALLNAPGLGPVVVRRLEQIGIDSLAKLRAVGVDAAVERICDHIGTASWANRRRSLRRLCIALDACSA